MMMLALFFMKAFIFTRYNVMFSPGGMCNFLIDNTVVSLIN